MPLNETKVKNVCDIGQVEILSFLLERDTVRSTDVFVHPC